MEKAFPKGTEVLIFNHIRDWGENQDNYHYKKGVIEKSVVIQDPSYLSESSIRNFYTVLGEDGKNYFGTYGNGTIGGSFFRTKEDQAEYLTREIRELQENTELLQKQILSLLQARQELLQEDNVKEQKAK